MPVGMLSTGVASLVSGTFAMIENRLGFQLMPRQPFLDKRIGQHITGLQRDDGGIEWSFARKQGAGIVRAVVRLYNKRRSFQCQTQMVSVLVGSRRSIADR